LLYYCAVEVFRTDREIGRQGSVSGDVEQYAAPEQRRDGVDGQVSESFVMGLAGCRVDAAVEFPVAGEMAQPVDVRADVGAHRNGGGR